MIAHDRILRLLLQREGDIVVTSDPHCGIGLLLGCVNIAWNIGVPGGVEINGQQVAVSWPSLARTSKNHDPREEYYRALRAPPGTLGVFAGMQHSECLRASLEAGGGLSYSCRLFQSGPGPVAT
jgi:hypothetical protein